MAPGKGKKPEKKLLVLDLDETLVHARQEMFGEEADFSFSYGCNYNVKLRPGVRQFLETVSKIFDVAIFTASPKEYADKIIDFLDPNSKLISRRLTDSGLVKDLSVLEHDLAKVVMVDNCPDAFRLHKSNGIPIKSWFVDPDDGELASLLPFLKVLSDAEDVRPLIVERFGCYNNKKNASGSTFRNPKGKGVAIDDGRAEKFSSSHKKGRSSNKKNASGILVKQMEKLKV